MSNITVVNRKFLQEQVKNCLKEQIQEPSYLSRMDPVRSAAYEQGRLTTTDLKNVFTNELPKLLTKIGKEIIDIPEYFYKKFSRELRFGGNFYRHALVKHKDSINSEVVKQFFSLFQPIDSTRTSITKFRQGYGELFDDDFYKPHDDLVNIFNKHRESNDRKKLLDSLILHLGATNSQSAGYILADEADLVKNIKNKELDYDEFAISLFKTGNQYSMKYDDIFDFIEQLKEEYLDTIKQEKGVQTEALIFLVVAEVDSHGVSGFQEYKDIIFTELEKNPDLEPWNIVRGLSLATIGHHIEKKIQKRPLTFWRSLVAGFAVGLGLDLADQDLNIPGVTSKAEIDNIVKLMKLAESGIKNAGMRGGATAEEEKEIRKLVLEAVEIVRVQFRQKLESEGLMMSIKDKVGAFDQLSKQFKYATDYFDPSNFSVTEDNWRILSRNIQYFRNAIIEVYKKYEISLSELSPLEEQKNTLFESKLVRIDDANEIVFKQSELDTVKELITENDIANLVKIYNLNQYNIYTKYETIKSEFGNYIGDSLSAGGKSRGRFRQQFKTWWSRNLKKQRIKKSGIISGEEFSVIPSIFSKDYFKKGGLYHEFAGRGGIFGSTEQLNLVSITNLDTSIEDDDNQVAKDDPKYATTHYFAAYDSRDEDKYILNIVNSSGPVVRVGDYPDNKFLPFQHLILQKALPSPVSIDNTAKAFEKLRKQTTTKGGNLITILAIHNIYSTYLKNIMEGGLKAERKLVTKFNQKPNNISFTNEELILFKFFYLIGDIELFNKENNISFFRIE